MTVTDYEQAMRVHFFGALYVASRCCRRCAAGGSAA